MEAVPKPASLFDRDAEWSDLARFTSRAGGRLGVIWGPRRVGKSYLLQAFCDQVGGLYLQAVRQDPALFLASLGRDLGEWMGAPAPLHLGDWPAAIAALLDAPNAPLVVLDEFPYLVEGSPELPTVVQAAVDRRQETAGRLVLCGSAVTQMTSLLSADGPLFRRSSLSLAVRPFDLRTSSRFWGVGGRAMDALAVHAVVGGTPGYLDVLGPMRGDVHAWIVDRVLDPSTATFYEDDLVFATDPSLPDANVYRSILAAIVAGNRTPTSVAKATARKATSLGRPIDRMVSSGLVTRTSDPLRAKRSLLDVGDPFLRFHYAIIRPNRAALARRRAEEVWARSAETFRSQVLGPHFEAVCREGVLDFDLDLPPVAEVGVTVLNDPATRTAHEVDVIGTDDHGQVVLIGEAKASTAPRTVDMLTQLDRMVELIPDNRRASRIHRVVFAANGADAELVRAAASRDDVSIIDAETLVG